MARFVAGAPQSDDCTVLALRLPQAESGRLRFRPAVDLDREVFQICEVICTPLCRQRWKPGAGDRCRGMNCRTGSLFTEYLETIPSQEATRITG
jgi:hypothetical protein